MNQETNRGMKNQHKDDQPPPDARKQQLSVQRESLRSLSDLELVNSNVVGGHPCDLWGHPSSVTK